MKKLFLVLLFSLVLGALSFAQTVQKTYHFDNPTVSRVNGYDVISFDGTTSQGETGKATLPCQHVSLLLPPNTEARSITVDYSDFVEMDGTYNLLPRQKPRTLSSTEPLVFESNGEFYGSAEVYPATTVSKVNTQYLNGCAFAFAQFTPVRYVPATGNVSYAQSVTVTVELTAAKTDRSGKLWMTPEVQGRVERLAQNPEAVRDYKTRARTVSGYELLVITPQEWVPHFDEYVDFYKARGLRTHVEPLEDILADFEGRDDAEKMRNYIIQQYDEEGIMMVLLGGDSNVVPWRALYCFAQEGYEDNLPADMYFACLDGTWNDDNDDRWGEVGEDDLLPELAIARMPFNNETQFDNMMHKTLAYQTNPVLGEFRTVILGAEDLGDGYYGSNDLERLIGRNSDFDYTTVGIPEDYDFVKYYASPTSSWGGGVFKGIINQSGGQYVHHVGHADTDFVAGWYVNTTNDNSFAKLDGVHHNYNFFHSHGCICGDFTHTCMLERLVNIATGFVATTGNSRYGWYQPWGDGMAAHLHREFVDAYYNDSIPYIGTAFVEMKIATAPFVNEMFGEEGCLRWNDYCLNILGDVAVSPWLDEPFRPEVRYPSALAMGAAVMTVSVHKEGRPLQKFRCSIFHNGEMLGYGLTDANGNADIEFAEPLNIADTMQLIVTGQNAWPQTITIIGLSDNTAFVYPEDIELQGGFNTGGDVMMDVSFRNAGTADAVDVTATLSTASEYVNLSKATVEVGTVNAGAAVPVDDAFELEVATNIPDQTIVDLVMTCTDGNNFWNRDVFFKAQAPSLTIDGIEYVETVGNMNGLLDPGETFVFNVTGTNKGHYIASNPYIHASADNQGVSFVTNNVSFADIEAGGTFVATVEIEVSGSVPEGTAIAFDFEVSSGDYVANGSITLCIGLLKEDFETGDFTLIDWMMGGDADWFVTDSIAHTGSYSAQCGNIGPSQITSIMVDINTTTDGSISFYYKTFSKYKRDYLIFLVDNLVQGYWSGDNDWTQVSFDIEAGQHTVEWRYDTSASGATNGNVCWVDDIVFPGNTYVLDEVVTPGADEVTVYPNPVTDVVYIKGADVKSVEVYNALGVRVVSQDNNTESVDMSGFATGMYFVRTLDGKGNIVTTKIIRK